MCGSLQCQMGTRYPIVAGMDQMYSRTLVSMGGREFECKYGHSKKTFLKSCIRKDPLLSSSLTRFPRITSGTVAATDLPDLGIVRDGTPCGNNLICINKTCTSIHPYIDRSKCPSNNVALDCSGHGVCSNVNSCFCNPGWTGHDCSTQTNITYPGYNVQQEKESDNHYRQASAITGAPPASNGLTTPPPATQTQNSKTTSYGIHLGSLISIHILNNMTDGEMNET